ncbi:hypothetical protein M446_2726 [Methylobacterium sp. 4-46]|uniref:NepR family anti-sigma factor n=1 Tax=unclassified Methylobacterium TaxID=2615210 RepID=UPI000165C79D|nr:MULTISPECIES: NepR family anti-sigma factor [Methylobacterium]ACA17165.1 hypothetical protein M446_2726 [Methylobacterium sp. 4-46]WFT82849.1 NepR family anti-sigma factor [Methylobacterium nodulans]
MIDGKGMGGAQTPADHGVAGGSDQPGLDRLTQGRLGSHLRAMYDELVQQPIPERFVELLASLDQPAETSKNS